MLNKIFNHSDEVTELDHLYEMEALREDLLRDEDLSYLYAPDDDEEWAEMLRDAIERDDFKEEMKQREKERRKMEETERMKTNVPIWVTRPQKELLNRFFKKQKPRTERKVWRDIANALVVSGLRTSDEIKEMINLCDQGGVDKDLYFTDVLRIEFSKED